MGEGNCGEFDDSLQIRQSFTRQLLVVSKNDYKLGLILPNGILLAIRQSFPRQSFPLYGSTVASEVHN